jgi:ribosomal protein S18 acetylase RimI-like enzyme
MTVLVRDLTLADEPRWRELYREYLEFYEAQKSETSIDLVWQRLTSEPPQIHSFVAELDGLVVGLCHFHYQVSTWSDTTQCYLEDMYVDEAVRRQGVARTLIESVKAQAASNAATEMYWITRQSNLRAQALYDKVATKTDFIRYEVSLTESD